MRVRYIFALTGFCLPYAAQATCEATFAKGGSPIGGLRFNASVEVPDLTPPSAIGQMRGIAVAKGYDVLVAEAEDGSMLIEQPQTGKARAFPITITATAEGARGTVQMEAKLRAGMLVSSDAAKAEMCSMLNQLKGGKAGLAAASSGMKAVGASAPLAISALAFSHQVSKDTERNAAAVPLRYTGKVFIIDGTVDYVTKDGDAYRVAYKIPHPHEEILRLPNTAPFKTDIMCMMAKGQAAYTLQLKPGKSIKLIGTFDDFNETRHVLWMKDCRPAK
jgi:hypothetical protein